MMKKIKFAALALAVLALGACEDFDQMVPQSGTLLKSQVNEVTNADPTRADAIYSSMYTKLGTPKSCGYSTPDDFGMIMIGFSSDLEAADVVMPNSNYNWFSVCGELSSRTATYRNPLIRYKLPYDVISAAHDVMNAYPADSEDPDVKAKIGEAYAIRAFAYMNLAPYFQFGYAAGGAAKPSVPLVTLETTEFANNPRANLGDVYDQIITDLNKALELIGDHKRPDKSKIDKQVVYGLLSRAYLYMEKWAEAADYAEKALQGYEFASKADVSKPFMMDLSEKNWMWGYDMTETLANLYIYATAASWLRAFSGYAYASGCQCYCYCNNLLYDMIPDTDIRKQWWLDENLHSTLLDGLTWGSASGQDIAPLTIADEKEAFLPYTNVKFGCYTCGTTTNDEDWCWMRAEEMLLNQCEGLAKSGNESKARELLTNFVRNYRDPKYDSATRGLSLADEIWFQRRVELWGEGFSNIDTRRLNRPLVRFHSSSDNYPDAFRFNMTADDGWWLMRFSQRETNNNMGIVDNTEGSIPSIDQHPELRDGVTD